MNNEINYNGYTHICKPKSGEINEFCILAKIVKKYKLTVVIKCSFIDLQLSKLFKIDLELPWFEFNKYYEPLTVNDCEVLEKIAKL